MCVRAIVCSSTISLLITEFPRDQQYDIEWYAVYLILIIWTTISLYHQNSVIACMSVTWLFNIIGPYEIILGHADAKKRMCFVTMSAAVLTGLYIINKLHFKYALEYLNVFEPAMIGCAPFVGCLCMLLLLSTGILLIHVLTLLYYLQLFYVGDVFKFPVMKRIGKVFLVIFIMNMQAFLLLNRLNNYVYILLIIILDLYGISYLIDKNTKIKYFT